MSARSERGTASAVLATVLVALLIVLIVVGGYLGGWWLQKDATNRDARIRVGGYERQQSLIDRAQQEVSDAAGLPAGPQRIAITNQACRDIARITVTLPADLAGFQAQEC